MIISRDVYSKIKESVSSAERILVCINGRSSYDTHVATLAFVLHLKDLGKNVSVCVGGRLSTKHKRLFKKIKVDYQKKLASSNYVISIDHTEGEIEKVSYDDKEGKFNLYITPAKDNSKFNFDNVAFSLGGGDFDMVFVFGARSLKWLGKLYEKSKDVFDKGNVINVNNIEGIQEFGTEKLVNTEVSVSEIVYGMVNSESTPSTDTIVQLLMRGVMEYLQPMQRSDYKISTIEALTSLSKLGADIKESVQNLYFKRSFGNFKIVQKVMGNLKYDKKSGLAWSGVSSFDINQSGITKESFELDGRIIFNICEDFRLAFVMYEITADEVWVEFESNTSEFDPMELMKDFRLLGNSARITFIVTGKSMVEVEKEILNVLREKLDVPGFVPVANGSSGKETKHDELTESLKNDNNTPDKTKGTDGSVLIKPPPITPSS